MFLPVLKLTYVAVCSSNTDNCNVVILLITEKVAKMIPLYSKESFHKYNQNITFTASTIAKATFAQSKPESFMAYPSL